MKSNITRNDYGQAKHNVPAVREWSNSIYAYNKNYLSNIPVMDNVLAKLLTMYLHMIPKENNTKSKRMRDLLRRSSTRQLFLSKPEVKQNNDKAIINLFTFDRNKSILNKKLFRLNNKLDRLIQNTLSINKFDSIRSTLRNKFLSNRAGYVDKLNSNTLSNSLVNTMTVKNNRLNNQLLFNFLKWVLNMFNYNIILLNKGARINITIKSDIKSIIMKKDLIVINQGNKFNNINKVKCLNTQNYVSVYSYDSLNKDLMLVKLNRILLCYCNVLINKHSNGNNIRTLWSYYYTTYISTFLKKRMRKEKLTMNLLYKSYINKFKLGKLSLGIKCIIQNIYNKKVELNFISLKHIHLNSDLLTEAVAIKLRKKTSRLLRVLRKAIKLVKTPFIIRRDNGFNYMNLLNNYRHVKTKLSVNKRYDLQSILSKIFPNNVNNFISKDNSNIINDLFDSVKYKWTTGIRLEAKGRLTKRFTASRALFKYKYKGSLENLEHLTKPRFTNKPVSNIMIRNQIKPNLQYSFIQNKKRIGIYGIKGWISSN